MKSIKILAAAGLLAVVGAAPVAAWSGDLVKCHPTPGSPIDVTFKKGLSCVDTLNKIGIKLKAKNGVGNLNGPIDGCAANPDTPWDAWVAGKLGKTSEADALTIAMAELSIKGQTFGSCDFGGSDTSGGASGAGALTFFAADGATKVKGAKLKFFGTIAGDAATFSAQAIGLVTKGLGIGGDITIGIGLDAFASENADLIQCNLGNNCTNPGDPNEVLNAAPAGILRVVTDANSELTISYGDYDPNDPNSDYSALP